MVGQSEAHSGRIPDLTDGLVELPMIARGRVIPPPVGADLKSTDLRDPCGCQLSVVGAFVAPSYAADKDAGKKASPNRTCRANSHT